MRWLLILVTSCWALAIAGCAVAPSSAVDQQGALPSWTTKTQFTDARSGREVFVGVGEATTEPEARRRARSDAQSLYVRAVGGIVTTSLRVMETEESDAEGIGQQRISSERYTGRTSSAFLKDVESSQVMRKARGVVTVYERMSVPLEVLYKARAEAKRAHEATIRRQAEASRLAQSSRSDVSAGRVYGYVSREASVERGPRESRLQAEGRARKKARHEAMIAVAKQIHGSQQVSFSSAAGEAVRTSYTATSGSVRSELIAERVWWQGREVVAESYVLGWTDKE